MIESAPYPFQPEEARENSERIRQRQDVIEFAEDYQRKLSHLPSKEMFDDLPEVEHWNMAAQVLRTAGAEIASFGTGWNLRKSKPKPEEGQVITGREVVGGTVTDTFSAYYPPHQPESVDMLGVDPSTLVYERDRSPFVRGPESRSDWFIQGGLAFKVPTVTDLRDPKAVFGDHIFGEPYVVIIEDGINETVLDITDPRGNHIKRAVDEAAYRVLENLERMRQQQHQVQDVGQVAVQYS